MPSQIRAHSQLKCYGYVSPLQLKRNMEGLGGLEESKRSGPQSIPSLPGPVAAKGLYSCRRKLCLWPGGIPCCPLCRHCVSSEEAGIQLNLCFHLAFQFVLYGIKEEYSRCEMLHLVLTWGTSPPGHRPSLGPEVPCRGCWGTGDGTLHESQQTGDEHAQNWVTQIHEDFCGC